MQIETIVRALVPDQRANLAPWALSKSKVATPGQIIARKEHNAMNELLA